MAKLTKKQIRWITIPVLVLAILFSLLVVDYLVIANRIERYSLPQYKTKSDIWAFVGSDSRFDIPDYAEVYSKSQHFSERADLVFLAQKNGDTLQILSIPRDIDVNVPDVPKPIRLTLAYMFGTGEFSRVLCQHFHTPVNHMLTITLAGVDKIINDLGGITIDLPTSLRDPNFTKANFKAGTQTINGRQALQLIRTRHFEEYKNHRWEAVSDEQGTLHRSMIAKQVFRQVLTGLKQTYNPITWQKLAWHGTEHVSLDDHSEISDLTKLLSHKIVFTTLDTEVTSSDKLHRKITAQGWQQLKDFGFDQKCTTPKF